VFRRTLSASWINQEGSFSANKGHKEFISLREKSNILLNETDNKTNVKKSAELEKLSDSNSAFCLLYRRFEVK